MDNLEKYYEEKLDLEYEYKEPWERNLVVLRNGNEVQDLRYSDLFEGFDSINAVTFSSSYRFFDEISQGYKKADIILGLPTSDFISLYKQAFRSRKTDFNHVNEKTRTMIAEEDISVRYGGKDLVIHDKFYILSKPGLTRLIIGSANMSKQAFSENINQAETVSYHDNNAELIELFSKRFEYFKEKTSPYFPDKQIRFYKETGTLLLPKDRNDEEDDLDTIEVMPVEMLDKIKTELSESESENEQNEYYLRIIDKSITKGSRGISKKDKSKIKDAVSKIKKPHEIEEAAKSVEDRAFIINKPETPYLYQNSAGSIRLTDISYTREELIAGLNNIDEWISTYKSFSNYNSEIGRRVMEIIMSAFNAAFFKEIRNSLSENRRESEITRIPVILFLAGQANSGKSVMLEYLSKLLGTTKAVSYKDLKNQNSRVYNLIDSAFVSGNQMPMLIDEFDNKQIRDSDKAMNQFIKAWSNNLDTTTCLITATNYDDFSMPEEVKRRTKFFMMPNIFNEDVETEVDYGEEINKATNRLFLIFAKKYIDSLGTSPLYETKRYKTDYLKNTRNIFKDMYIEAGLAVPEYLSEEIVDDYDLVGRRTWKHLLNQYPDDFKRSTNDDGKKTLTLPSVSLL